MDTVLEHNNEKYMIASRMIAKGMSYEEVSEFFNVTPEEIRKLLSGNKVHEDITEYRADV